MRFLLDEHLSPEIARILGAKRAVALRDWHTGMMLGLSDRRILEEATQESLVLVTFDLATVPALLQEMTAHGEPHGGVVFISSRTFAQNDSAGIAAALLGLHRREGKLSWVDRAVFLTRRHKG